MDFSTFTVGNNARFNPFATFSNMAITTVIPSCFQKGHLPQRTPFLCIILVLVCHYFIMTFSSYPMYFFFVHFVVMCFMWLPVTGFSYEWVLE
jgi:hypothetical protein